MAKKPFRRMRNRPDVVVMDRSDPTEFNGKCELCGTFAELRPYGPGGKNVCFACGMKDEANTAAMFMKHLLGDT